MDLVITLVASGGVLSLVGTVLLALFQRRKVAAEVERVGAEAAEAITRSATGVVALVHAELDTVATALREARKEIDALRRHLTTVETLIRDAGLTVPEFTYMPERRRNGSAH